MYWIYSVDFKGTTLSYELPFNYYVAGVYSDDIVTCCKYYLYNLDTNEKICVNFDEFKRLALNHKIFGVAFVGEDDEEAFLAVIKENYIYLINKIICNTNNCERINFSEPDSFTSEGSLFLNLEPYGCYCILDFFLFNIPDMDEWISWSIIWTDCGFDFKLIIKDEEGLEHIILLNYEVCDDFRAEIAKATLLGVD